MNHIPISYPVSVVYMQRHLVIQIAVFLCSFISLSFTYIVENTKYGIQIKEKLDHCGLLSA